MDAKEIVELGGQKADGEGIVGRGERRCRRSGVLPGADADKAGREPGALAERNRGHVGVINFGIDGFEQRLFVQEETIFQKSDAAQIPLVLTERRGGKVDPAGAFADMGITGLRWGFRRRTCGGGAAGGAKIPLKLNATICTEHGTKPPFASGWGRAERKKAVPLERAASLF